MSEWILILLVSWGGETEGRQIGRMVDSAFCEIAGAGTVEIYEQATPGLEAGFLCVEVMGQEGT